MARLYGSMDVLIPSSFLYERRTYAFFDQNFSPGGSLPPAGGLLVYQPGRNGSFDDAGKEGAHRSVTSLQGR